MMYELIQVLNNTYYINCPAKIGLYLDGDKGVYLIDSGNDKEAGRKVRQILDKNGWTLRAILCTHSHADHRRLQYLQAQTGCKVYAPGVERDFTRHTLLEPALLYGGFSAEGAAAQVFDGAGVGRGRACIRRASRRALRSFLCRDTVLKWSASERRIMLCSLPTALQAVQHSKNTVSAFI